MNFDLINYIVEALEGTNLTIQEGIKKSWDYGYVYLRGVHPNKKEMKAINRITKKSPYSGIWHKTHKTINEEEKYSSIKSLSENEKIVLKSLQILGYKQICKTDSILIPETADYEIEIDYHNPCILQIPRPFRMFSFLENDVLYNIQKLFSI